MSVAAERLPWVDEHSLAIPASPEPTWEALLHVIEASLSGARATRYCRLVGCVDTAASGPRPLAEGSVMPAFHVATAEAPRQLVLRGTHRFSDYALTFRLDDLSAARTELRAETRAAFPGLKGGVYRGLVIGTRIHVLVTRRILAATGRRAERSVAATGDDGRG